MYHDIVTTTDKTSGFQNESAFQYKVEATAFEEQVKAVDGKDVVFTFDDGGESFYTKAAPILEKYGRKGVFFIAADYIGTPGFLSKEQIAELSHRGHVIGSHSCSHPQNMSGMTREKIEEEWSQSVKVLSDIIGEKVIIASLPNGNSSKIIIEGVKNAGIEELHTSEPTTKKRSDSGVVIIGRYVVHDKMTTEDIMRIVDDSNYRKKMHLKWRMLSIAKSILGNNYKKIKTIFIR